MYLFNQQSIKNKNIAKQYAIDNHLSPVRQNRTFSASYGIESEIWLVSVSEP